MRETASGARQASKLGAVAALLGVLCGCGGGGGGDPPAPQQAPPSTPPPVQTANRAPVAIVSRAALPAAALLHPYTFDFRTLGAFTDADADLLAYSIAFNGPARGLAASGSTLSGVPSELGGVEVTVTVSDGRGGSATLPADFVVYPNSPPLAVRPNGAVLTVVGAHVNYDASKGGLAFADGERDVLTYQVVAVTPPLGLTIQGTRVSGSLTAVGSATFKITASDGYGGVAEDQFAIAAPAAEPGNPALPAAPDVYADVGLNLPPDVVHARQWGSPLWDKSETNGPTNAGATLGRVLFYDKRLSITNTHSCASCHRQSRGFASTKRFDTGVPGLPLPRNTMSLTNVRYNIDNRYFSDKRVHTLENLVLLPIESPTELGNYLSAVETKLAATGFYPPLFEAAFGSREVTRERIALALAQFLRALISYRSRFDAALGTRLPPQIEHRPDSGLFTLTESNGFSVFLSRCSFCHGTVAQTLDVATNIGLDAVVTDPGIGGGRFRAASLRNIELTAPYMHDGRFNTLREVIDHYDHGVQAIDDLIPPLKLPDGSVRRLNLTEEEKVSLEIFLSTLSDPFLVSDPKFSDPFL